MQEIGRDWRAAAEGRAAVPPEVQHWWSKLRARAALPLSQLGSEQNVCRILLQLVAAADEACTDVGIPDPGSMVSRGRKNMVWEATLLLQRQRDRREPSTLCKFVPCSLLAVLPKLHTPASGATLRSLTHNLALHDNVEIAAKWHQITTELDHAINVLCVPWPLQVAPVDFSPAQEPLPLENMRTTTDFFDYTPPKSRGFVDNFRQLLTAAKTAVGSVDAVVFPELALDIRTFGQIRAVLDKESPAAFLIAGVRSRHRNDAFCSIPAKDFPIGKFSEVRQNQAKHHRWKLDLSQIQQYGLGGRLDAESMWWESTVVEPRTMNFFSVQPWLTIGVLICEDLARQDPAADLIRAVGPNLVVALLMDGPQLPSRWPGRYATVLADDPGSSVLTLSSLGMVLLSKPYDKPTSRVVGLWKDVMSSAAVPIELPPNKSGIVLSLSRRYREEFTADGRSDEEATAYLRLTGMHAI